jgi:hypothetical protein
MFQIATTIPAIKPLIFRYFPKLLGLSSLQHTSQLSTARHVQGHETYPRRNTLDTPPSEIDLECVKSPATPHSEDYEIDVSTNAQAVHTSEAARAPKSRPLILQPVISAFSTYRHHIEQEKPATHPAPRANSASMWKSSHPTAPEALGDSATPVGSLRTSLSSFNTASARHVSVESEE